MCFGSDAAEESRMDAQRARAQAQADEDARQGRIKTGQERINSAFSQFDDPYYNKFQNDYIGSQTPDVENQYTAAKDKLTAALAGRGVLNSTIAGNAFGEVEKKANDARSQIATEAGNASNAFRTSVEKTKSDLYSLNTASADPDAITARATGEAVSLVPQKATGGLGDIFGSVLSPLVNYTKASMYSPTGRGSFFSNPTSGGGNGRVIG